MCESLLFYLSLIYRQVTLVVQVMTMTGRLKSALKTSRSAPQFVHSPKHQQKSAKTLAFVISWWCQCTGGVSVLVVSVHWWCQCTGGVSVLVVSMYWWCHGVSVQTKPTLWLHTCVTQCCTLTSPQGKQSLKTEACWPRRTIYTEDKYIWSRAYFMTERVIQCCTLISLGAN